MTVLSRANKHDRFHQVTTCLLYRDMVGEMRAHQAISRKCHFCCALHFSASTEEIRDENSNSTSEPDTAGQHRQRRHRRQCTSHRARPRYCTVAGTPLDKCWCSAGRRDDTFGDIPSSDNVLRATPLLLQVISTVTWNWTTVR